MGRPFGGCRAGREEQIRSEAFSFDNFLTQPVDVTKRKTPLETRGNQARESDPNEFLESEPRNSPKAKECSTQITLGQGGLIFLTVDKRDAMTQVSWWCLYLSHTESLRTLRTSQKEQYH